MSVAKHTPGPWHIHFKADHKDGADLPWIGGHMGRPLAFITHESILKEDLERAQANARLIAAAPELLQATAALMALLITDPRYEGSECIEIAKAAIAKATGQ